MSNDRVGIIGIGQSAFTAHRDDASYPDLVREAVVLAMNDAGLAFDDIQAVVYSLSPDSMVGIGNAERLGVDAVGARNKRFLRINTGGATGISSVAAAYYHVASGACDVVLTAGADKVGECGDSQTVLNKIWDPTYERQLPLGTINMLAMSAIRYMSGCAIWHDGVLDAINVNLLSTREKVSLFVTRFVFFVLYPDSARAGDPLVLDELEGARTGGIGDLLEWIGPGNPLWHDEATAHAQCVKDQRKGLLQSDGELVIALRGHFLSHGGQCLAPSRALGPAVDRGDAIDGADFLIIVEEQSIAQRERPGLALI
jgi:hypothetical protein